MNSIFSRSFKVLFVVVAVAVLSACSASSTVNPFAPKRVIGLGDAYNDVGSSGARFTVRGTGAVSTVVEQVAALFGVSSEGTYSDAGTYTALPPQGVFSYAVGGSLVSTGANSLQVQIAAAAADVGGTFADTDLIVITAGTGDILNGTDAKDAYVTLIKSLVDTYNAKHILIMQPLEIATTPFGKASAGGTYSATVANDFFVAMKSTLQTYITNKGVSYNPIIFGAAGLSSDFNIYTAVNPPAVGQFTTSTSVPYCTNWNSLTPTVFVGCATIGGDIANATNYDTILFADGINLTPAGNRWVASYLYNATAQGWR